MSMNSALGAEPLSRLSLSHASRTSAGAARRRYENALFLRLLSSASVAAAQAALLVAGAAATSASARGALLAAAAARGALVVVAAAAGSWSTLIGCSVLIKGPPRLRHTWMREADPSAISQGIVIRRVVVSWLPN